MVIKLLWLPPRSPEQARAVLMGRQGGHWHACVRCLRATTPSFPRCIHACRMCFCSNADGGCPWHGMAPPQVAMNVGVYYCANAVGRLEGTLASGAIYSYVGSSVVDGFGTCLLVSVAFCALSTLIDLSLQEDLESPWLPKWLRSRGPSQPPQAQAQSTASEQTAAAREEKITEGGEEGKVELQELPIKGGEAKPA
jgi:hypothetical protein